MKKSHIKLPEIKLIGITTRTNNKNEFDSSKSRIMMTVEKYFRDELPEQIPYRKNPGVTYCAYTDYESDQHGDYTYFIGEEVIKFGDDLPEFTTKLIIPPQNYVKFTKGPGKMPDICIEMWQEIFTMSNKDLGGNRNHITDFEIYDERSKDLLKTTLDIYLGIDK